MLVEEITVEKYKLFTKDIVCVYANYEFNELNKYKVEQMKYLLFRDNKLRFTLCAGVLNKKLFCPFSAPFGMLLSIKDATSIQYYENAIKALDSYILSSGFKGIQFILPPFFYNESNISVLMNIFFRNDYIIKYIDLNFQFKLRELSEDNYINKIRYNAKKNLEISLKADLELFTCTTEDERKRAYNIIAINRESKGYPLRMSYEQVASTIKIIENDFFIVKRDNIDIAAAIIFHVNQRIAQVIYWGDIPGNTIYKPINYLAYQLILYYKKSGFNYLDIGPSTENGIPNFGLCDFKQSIGCEVNNKITVEKILDN